MFSDGCAGIPLIVHSLVKMEPDASHLKFADNPSMGSRVELTTMFVIFSVEEK